MFMNDRSLMDNVMKLACILMKSLWCHLFAWLELDDVYSLVPLELTFWKWSDIYNEEDYIWPGYIEFKLLAREESRWLLPYNYLLFIVLYELRGWGVLHSHQESRKRASNHYVFCLVVFEACGSFSSSKWNTLFLFSNRGDWPEKTSLSRWG